MQIKALCELFDLPKGSATKDILTDIYSKDILTYFLSREGDKVVAKDISTLDVMLDNQDISEWGGLTEFSTRVNDVVSNYMAKYGEN